MSDCNCNVTLLNTGKPGCVPIQKVTKKIFAFPLYANDGTKNFIDTTQTLDQAFWDALINKTDDSKRLYPLPELKNVTSEKAESVFEEFEDTSKILIHEGKRSFTGVLPKETTIYLNQLKAALCREIGIYMVDKDGKLIYTIYGDTATEAHPIQIDNASWNPVYVMPTDKTVAKINLSFDWSISQADEDLRMLSKDDVEDVNLLALEGLVDATIAFVSIGQTAMVFDVLTKFGTGKTPVKVEGLLSADFFSAVGGTANKVYDTTASANVSIVSLTESDGRYTITYASQTVGHVLRVTPVKNGFAFTANSQAVV